MKLHSCQLLLWAQGRTLSTCLSLAFVPPCCLHPHGIHSFPCIFLFFRRKQKTNQRAKNTGTNLIDHRRVCACSTLLSFGWIFQFILHQQHTLRVPWLTLKIPKAPSLALFTYPNLFPHTTPGNFHSFNKCLYADGSPSLNM